MTAGVYAVFVTGTKCVYVGESSHVERRFRQHDAKWVRILMIVRPGTTVSNVVIRRMDGSTLSDRRRVEVALSRLLRRRGYVLLSLTQPEIGRIGAAVSELNKTPEQRERQIVAARAVALRKTREERRAMGRAAQAKLTPEQKRELGRLAGVASLAAFSPEQRREKALMSWGALTPEQRSERIRNGSTPEQRSERMRIGWLKRRANKEETVHA